MTCKDCVHYEACKDMYDGYSCDFDDCNFAPNCIDVGLFKNKADFVEVKHGEWVRDVDWQYDFRCSVCDDLAIKGEYNNYDVLTDFCPHCGADMRKEGADNDS